VVTALRRVLGLMSGYYTSGGEVIGGITDRGNTIRNQSSIRMLTDCILTAFCENFTDSGETRIHDDQLKCLGSSEVTTR
jgi:hypothetical protein